MAKYILVLPALLFSMIVSAQGGQIKSSNTIAVKDTDSKERIIEKAAHVIPTANQLKALQREFIAFIHFGPNTFTRMEWGTGMEDPEIFDLKTLDTDQWCAAMKAAGMKLVILTVKHHDGFVLWQSRYTRHGIMSTNFEEGRGDILRDLTASCKKYGLKLGIYLSPADLYQIENPEGLYGNLSKYTRRTIPRPVEGRPFANKTTFEFEVDDYNEYFLNQLFELLTEYGPVDEVWFDGAHPKTKGGQQYNYAAWKELIHTLAPNAVIFGKEDIRWCGNEAGATRKAEWNVIGYRDDPAKMVNFPDMTAPSLGSREDLYQAKYLHYQPAETNTSIREGWFYRDDERQKVRSTDDVFDIYERSVGGNSIFLLNIPPNRQGRFSPRDSAVLYEVGKRIEKTYGNNLFAGAEGPKEVLDENEETYFVLPKENGEILITTPSPVTINRLVLGEAVATHSERVEKHVAEAWIRGEWQEIARAENIGYKRILRFPEVTSNRFRIRFEQCRMAPAIRTVSGHYYEAAPPEPAFRRDKAGMVTIEPVQSEFNWKPHGQNAARNLSAGSKVYYTLDGSKPGTNSKKYTGPFKAESKKVTAVFVYKGKEGPVGSEIFGLIKEGWGGRANSEAKEHGAALAIDGDEKTYWQADGKDALPMLSLDFGKVYRLKSFAYTPPGNTNAGLIAKGRIQISEDGKNWKDADSFTFGNLVNDPTRRQHDFKTPLKTRFLRLLCTETARKTGGAAIAELDFFE